MWANLVVVADAIEQCYWRVTGVSRPAESIYLTLGYLPALSKSLRKIILMPNPIYIGYSLI